MDVLESGLPASVDVTASFASTEREYEEFVCWMISQNPSIWNYTVKICKALSSKSGSRLSVAKEKSAWL